MLGSLTLPCIIPVVLVPLPPKPLWLLVLLPGCLGGGPPPRAAVEALPPPPPPDEGGGSGSPYAVRLPPLPLRRARFQARAVGSPPWSTVEETVSYDEANDEAEE